MTEKLVKTGNDYILYSKDKTVLGITSGTMEGRMLSLKNCESIANGYDLDELVKEQYPIDEPSFKRGFKLALEILGDKKFSEKELTMLFAYGHQIGMNTVLAIQSQHSPQPMPKPDSDKLRDELIQSLQQTEWDVIIEMECPECKEYGYVSECRNNCNQKFLQPKLDSDGCLILRRI